METCMRPIPCRTATRLALAAALALSAGGLAAEPVAYTLDPNHTMVLARWNHFGFSNPVASFGQGQGTLVYDPQEPAAARVEVTLPLSGLTGFVPRFDEHLRSADFFDAQNHPEARFRSTAVTPAGEGRLKVAGELTIKGITRPVVLDVRINKVGELRGRPAAGFDATATLRRSEFDLGRFVPNVSDEVQLSITTEALGPVPGE
jgi:polyisoprenoid-binding protein YceI